MAASKRNDDVLVAKNSFVAHVDGMPVRVRKGETFRVGHPVVEGRELYFDVPAVDNEWTDADEAARQERLKKAAEEKAAAEEAERKAAEEAEAAEAEAADKS